MNVRKRSGKVVPFNADFISRAIALASAAAGEMDQPMVQKATELTVSRLKDMETDVLDIEKIQDTVEETLFEQKYYKTAKAYILYRIEKDKERAGGSWEDGLLDREFLSTYKHAPNPMEQLGSFVYTRTYSRYLPKFGRREFWWETVRRAVEYNCSLAPTSKDEARKLYDNIYHLRQFLSGRTLWVGNTPVADAYPMANYNCAFEVIDDFSAYHDLFYLLMVGSGVGVRVLKEDAERLPKIRTDIEILHKAYDGCPPQDRLEFTDLTFTKDTAVLSVGDSKEGWAQALSHYFDILSNHEYSKIREIVVNYDSIRPRGERLKTFGGTASGHESMMAMLGKIHRVIRAAGDRDKAARTQLQPIDLLDIANIIGENVVSGGVRRTSEIGLIDADDQVCIKAKSNLYRQINGRWELDQSIAHRQMSNNSIYYKKKPSREQLHWHMQQMRYSGEPGWINEEAGKKRRPNFNGCNPCGEVLMDSHGLCNLTTLNVMGFVRDGKLDEQALLEAQRLSARAGYRMTCRDLEIHRWNTVQKRDRLLGCSMTGWQDMVNATGMSVENQRKLLDKLRREAHEAAEQLADRLGTGKPLLVTTIKPEGTLSLLPTVSSGVHYSHSPYYIRRVRINAADPLCRVCEELEYPVLPEVGQNPENATTKVVEFPVKAPAGKVKADVSAIEQLETYKMFMEHYVDHNCSITVHVREDEWEDTEQWVWDNWDDVVALSFLSYDDSFYELLPYEAITKEEYDARKAAMRPFNPSLLTRYEYEESDFDIGDSDCSTGACPVR
ncbi:ribonucleoside-triphosphate reductase, adenosylcobalamin-dependent [Ruminococcus sp. OA3]|uniref:ribonucleoside-triphosphate reductase, adenosylcobalamin-dependent n=1 Tax=Ruminococcus sp. OA3 TaxID=2914164 RepID=UPI001F0666D5|nr:ribonucleoside-triphosphate reductase, adenosylcobalamin-dependent [Ruminococcus sp. OA3]MCH1982440.1 ribonucleoside-triphosphate reductase, adenosylcobalamin-dependent [Ruminococcus sp. OA3]